MKKRYCFLISIVLTTIFTLFTNFVLMIEFSNIIFESLITCVLLTNIFNIWFNKLYIKDSSYIKLIPMSLCAILAINGLAIGSLYENKTEPFSTIIYLLTLIGFLGLIYFLYENGKSETKK